MPGDILAAADQVAGTVRSGVTGAVEEVTALVELIGRASALMDDAEKLVIRANAALANAERQLAQSEQQLGRTAALLDETDTMLAPFRSFAGAPSPALNLAKLEQVGPDVHAILENVADLSAALMGMPGMTWMQRRGVEKQNDDEHDHEHPER